MVQGKKNGRVRNAVFQSDLFPAFAVRRKRGNPYMYAYICPIER